jgi:hypothetical protein
MTAAEWKALETFRDRGLVGVPHLVAKICVPQRANGHFPGGYVSYTIMTLMPGEDLLALRFWSLDDTLKDHIRTAFVRLLKYVDGFPLFLSNASRYSTSEC